jgi:hypothetical protein
MTKIKKELHYRLIEVVELLKHIQEEKQAINQIYKKVNNIEFNTQHGYDNILYFNDILRIILKNS